MSRTKKVIVKWGHTRFDIGSFWVKTSKEDKEMCSELYNFLAKLFNVGFDEE